MVLLLLLVSVAVTVGVLVGVSASRTRARFEDVRYRSVPPPLPPGADPFAVVTPRPEWHRY